MNFSKYAKYFFFWVGYFLVARLIFVLYHIDNTQSIGFQNFIKIFTNGIRLDVSTAGYFSVLPFAARALIARKRDRASYDRA